VKSRKTSGLINYPEVMLLELLDSQGSSSLLCFVVPVILYMWHCLDWDTTVLSCGLPLVLYGVILLTIFLLKNSAIIPLMDTVNQSGLMLLLRSGFAWHG
jgi:hypothetical protein